MVLFALVEIGGNIAVWAANKAYYWMWPAPNLQQQLLLELKHVLENQNKIQEQLNEIRGITNEDMTLEKIEN